MEKSDQWVRLRRVSRRSLLKIDIDPLRNIEHRRIEGPPFSFFQGLRINASYMELNGGSTQHAASVCVVHSYVHLSIDIDVYVNLISAACFLLRLSLSPRFFFLENYVRSSNGCELCLVCKKETYAAHIHIIYIYIPQLGPPSCDLVQLFLP